MATVRTSIEGARGCGYRKPGGKYLVSGALSEPCSKLPIELNACPCCGGGIKPARGWTWITPDPLLDPGPHGSEEHEAVCPLGTSLDWTNGVRAGLIWVGGVHYPTPAHFTVEAARMGVSRRIHNVPRGFKVGETWVALGHAKAVVHPEVPEDEKGHLTPGVFTFFKPTAIEYIVKGDETDEELDALEEKGFDLVRVVKAEQIRLEEAQ